MVAVPSSAQPATASSQRATRTYRIIADAVAQPFRIPAGLLVTFSVVEIAILPCVTRQAAIAFVVGRIRDLFRMAHLVVANRVALARECIACTGRAGAAGDRARSTWTSSTEPIAIDVFELVSDIDAW